MLKIKLPDIREMFTSDLAQVDWKRTALLIAFILAAFSALWQYAMPTVKTITETRFQRVPEIKRVESVKRSYMACPEQGIQVLDKAEVSKKLDISWLQGGDIAASPASAQDKTPTSEVLPLSPEGAQKTSPPSLGGAGGGTGLQITATGDLPESDNGYELVSVIDASGVSEIQKREKAAPWWQLRNDAAIGVKYGVGQNLNYTGTAYGRWDFLRIKDVYISTNADLSTDGSARIQFGVEYRIKP